MCGIAGQLGLQPVDQRDVENQLSELMHRGPDSRGLFAHGRGAVGQSRLAVIDLVHGDPPICNEDGSIGVALNGEIYNFGELRQQLRNEGHEFVTSGDTEVLAHLAEAAAPADMAAQLHGMFTFAVWDSVRERLVVGRDRLGKKPLYFWSNGREVVFGSEIKAVLASTKVTARLDPSAIPAYLTFGYVPTPRTFFEGITSLPPGHVLIADADGVRTQRYWKPPIAGIDVPLRRLPFVQAARELRGRLTTAVQRRLVSDVPLGAFLSGGIDSSAIVAIMAGLTSQPVRTFTIGFEDDAGFDERAFARQVAERYRTDHVEFVVQPEAVDLLERMVWYFDQPFGDSSAVPTFLLSELTRNHVTVALCGDGGDELFAGYERFAAGVALARYQELPRIVRQAALSVTRALPSSGRPELAGKLQRFLSKAESGLPQGYRAWISYNGDDTVTALLPGADDWALHDYARIWDESRGADTLARLLDLNLRTYLLDDLLPKVDRMAMAHGLEVRSPFLDHELVEFAAALPCRYKQRGLDLKRVLKAAVADLLPVDIVHRKKHGFGVPLDRWFRDDLKAFVAGMLGSDSARVRQTLDGAALDRMLAEHNSRSRDHGHSIWTLLTLEVFLRRWGW